MLIIIISPPDDIITRDVIRSTWLKLSSKGFDYVRYLFTIGIKGLETNKIARLKVEHEHNGDLALLENLTESKD